MKKKKERKTNKQKQTLSQKLQRKNTGTKLISNTKKHKLKIQTRVWNFRYTMLYKRRRERNRGKKKVTEIIKNYRYKIDNKYQKAKIKNLEQSLEFQKYNVKEKKGKKKVKKIIKNIYMKFALKKIGTSFFFCKVISYKSEN